MADPGPKTGSDLLQEWCEKAQAILRQVVVQAPEDEDLITSMLTTKSPFKPHWVWDCDCLMFLEARKTGLLISRTHHRGFMLRRCVRREGDRVSLFPCIYTGMQVAQAAQGVCCNGGCSWHGPPWNPGCRQGQPWPPPCTWTPPRSHPHPLLATLPLDPSTNPADFPPRTAGTGGLGPAFCAWRRRAWA